LHAPLFEQLHPDWQVVLHPYVDLIQTIEKQLVGSDIAPSYPSIFRALSRPINQTRAVIFGQDPYPTRGHANGLAFSVEGSVPQLPPSLRNIFAELESDIGIVRTNGDLSDWFDQGVMLINRFLTTKTGSSLAHSDLEWKKVTNAVAEELGKHTVVGILWGKGAGELSHFFNPELLIQSVHPSPLSAYRGFFGSKPFSRCNEILLAHNVTVIDW